MTPEIDDLVVVAAEHDRHDVLADVVHVALHRGEQDLAARLAGGGLFGLHEGQQVRHRLLHGARALHHLGQEHLARAEEIADHAHAGHERPLDDVDGLAQLQPGLFHVRDDEVGDAVDQGVREPLLDGVFAPAQILGALLAFAFDLSGDLDQALGGVGPAVPDHVLHALAHSAGMSAYTPSWPALTMPMSRPAAMAW